MFFYLFLFKYRFAKNRIPYPKAIFILRFLLNKREGQVLANKFFGVNLSAETDYKFYIILFQTTKIQIFESNSQREIFRYEILICCFKLQRYKFLKAIHNAMEISILLHQVVSDYKDTNFLKAIYNKS